jgi:hypothetical protein
MLYTPPNTHVSVLFAESICKLVIPPSITLLGELFDNEDEILFLVELPLSVLLFEDDVELLLILLIVSVIEVYT